MVGKDRKVVMMERRVWRILSCMSTSCEVQLSIQVVWMMAGTGESEMARMAMRRWRELRER